MHLRSISRLRPFKKHILGTTQSLFQMPNYATWQDQKWADKNIHSYSPSHSSSLQTGLNNCFIWLHKASFALIHLSKKQACLYQKHIPTPNVPREINISVCAQPHTQKPLPVFKVFGNSIKDTRFRIYICVLLCLRPHKEEEEASWPICSKELATRPGLQAPAYGTTENNIHNSGTWC